ncbi:MAG: dephospho-CoA kinase [Bacillota bacterium]
MLKIALTGGMGTGKSTVAEIWNKLGVPVVSADKIAREVIEPSGSAREDFLRTFKGNYVKNDGSVDRAALGAHVFSHPVALKKLEGIVHPAVKKEVDRRLEDLAAGGFRAVLVEVPLLFETGWNKHFDLSVVVYATEKMQLDRIMRRDRLISGEAIKRIRLQMPMDEKMRLADYCIDNSGDLSGLEGRVRDAWRAVQTKYKLY